jgi:hypothetical protein
VLFATVPVIVDTWCFLFVVARNGGLCMSALLSTAAHDRLLARHTGFAPCVDVIAREVKVKPKYKRTLAGLVLGLAAMVALPGSRSFGAEQASKSNDPEIERTRQAIKMLDDLFKNVIVLVDATYVKKPSDVPAATAGKALFAAMKKGGWYDVRLLGLTDVIGDQDDVPRDAFEQTAAKKLVAGETWYEEVLEKDGKRYMRVATGIPVVSENCVMCHANFKGNKGNVGALSYTVPVIK